MTPTTAILDVTQVGQRAAQIHAALRTHELFDRLTKSSMKYTPCWATFTGMATVTEFNLDIDSEPLLVQALYALALKAAVFVLVPLVGLLIAYRAFPGMVAGPSSP
jgi:hypothetical protein